MCEFPLQFLLEETKKKKIAPPTPTLHLSKNIQPPQPFADIGGPNYHASERDC